MDPLTLVTFALALSLAVATPGPGAAVVIGRALGVGFRGALPMVLGLVVGDLTYLALACLGMAALAQSFGTLFTVVRFAGAFYLLYLAYRMWTADPAAKAVTASAADRPVRTFLTGLSVTLGNPKVVVFYLALLPTFIDLGRLALPGMAELMAICLLVLTAIMGCYAFAAARARALFQSPRATRLFNRGAGSVMAGAAGGGGLQ